MVLGVSVERMKPDKEEPRGYNWFKEYHEDFTVYIGEKRILTIFTTCPTFMKKWISEARKAYRNKKQPLVVGLCVDRELHYRKSGLGDNPFEILSLCIGSHCLIYSLPEGNNYSRGHGYSSRYSKYYEVPKALKEFLADPNTICVGIDTPHVAEKLKKDQDLKIKRLVDVYRLMLNVLGYKSLHTSADYNLDEITMKLLGKEMDVVRNKIADPWRERNAFFSHEINREYAKYLTVDAFFAHELGVKYLDLVTKMSSSNKKK